MKRFTILLATDDSAVEGAVKAVVTTADCDLNCANTTRDAMCVLSEAMTDRSLKRDLAVVDLDLRSGGRTLLRTAGGILPVIAITSEARPWLSSMLRRHRVGATLAKPVTPEKLRDAFRRVGRNACVSRPRGRWWHLRAALQRVGINLGRPLLCER